MGRHIFRMIIRNRLHAFLLFPFSRLVHVWSGFASVGYLFRPYQIVRSRRLGVGSVASKGKLP